MTNEFLPFDFRLSTSDKKKIKICQIIILQKRLFFFSLHPDFE